MNPKKEFKLTYVEQVLAWARRANIGPLLLTEILERRIAAGCALAWQLQQVSGVDRAVWLHAALPDAPENATFLAPPWNSHRPTAFDLIRSAPNPARDFWAHQLEKFAAHLDKMPPALLAHVICGNLRIKGQHLASRLARLIGMPEPESRYGYAVLPDQHELWVRPANR